MSELTSSKDNCKKWGKSIGNATLAHQSNEHADCNDREREACFSNGKEIIVQRDDMIVEWVTTNITKMLDSKLAFIIKLINKLSEKFNRPPKRIGTVEHQVLNLEDTLIATALCLDSQEIKFKRALDYLDSFEIQNQQNV